MLRGATNHLGLVVSAVIQGTSNQHKPSTVPVGSETALALLGEPALSGGTECDGVSRGHTRAG